MIFYNVFAKSDRGYNLFYASNNKWILIIQNVGKSGIKKQ